jgi:hypothetical protein
MYTTAHHQIMKARVADFHRQAQQDALASAAHRVLTPRGAHT